MHHRLGGPQDDAKAVYWWAKAAKQGNAMAQRNLGEMHVRARAFPKTMCASMRGPEIQPREEVLAAKKAKTYR